MLVVGLALLGVADTSPLLYANALDKNNSRTSSPR